jgi:molybdopterin converting factor small subunit
MATVWIPSLLRPRVGGRDWVTVAGRTLGNVIDVLEGTYPGLKDRLCLDGQLAPSVQALIDGRTAPLGLAEPVDEDSEIVFLPTISGG